MGRPPVSVGNAPPGDDFYSGTAPSSNKSVRTRVAPPAFQAHVVWIGGLYADDLHLSPFWG